LVSTVESEGETFEATPSALRISSGSTKLWAIDRTGTDELFSFTDTLATAGPALVAPADGSLVSVNPISGNAYDVSFTWEKPSSYTTEYHMQIAFDSGFSEKASDIDNIGSTSDTVAYIVGPNGTTALNYMPGTQYYWRVRTSSNGPIYSPWSSVRSFSLENLVASVPAILSPANGATGVKDRASFSWSPVAGITKYQIQIADNIDMSPTIANVQVSGTGYALPSDFIYGHTYYWRVKAIAPIEGEWSALANFTIMDEPKEPAPPIVVEEVPPPVINIPPSPPPPPAINIPPAPTPPAPIAPAYIWAVIIIGAILVIAVIVLIVRTRRPV
jgi:hypothetical protein